MPGAKILPGLLDAVAPWVSGLVVMDYRTDASEIYRFAVPYLDWGERHGKTVRIALEAGPIAPETRYRYEQAPEGELWQVQLEERHFLLMLRSARPNPHGSAFRLANSYDVREAEIANVPFLGALAGCSARRSERSVASHTSEEQRRNAPGSAAKNGILAFSASLIGRATTFYADTARLWRQLPELETIFSAWPGFAGMALHEIR